MVQGCYDHMSVVDGCSDHMSDGSWFVLGGSLFSQHHGDYVMECWRGEIYGELHISVELFFLQRGTRACFVHESLLSQAQIIVCHFLPCNCE